VQLRDDQTVDITHVLAEGGETPLVVSEALSFDVWPALPASAPNVTSIQREAPPSGAAGAGAGAEAEAAGEAGSGDEEVEERLGSAVGSAEAERIGREAKWAALERERLAKPNVASSLKARCT
jgi:hypothetical protein